jgi:1-acyl-sn-glycerol-3-phosphate acyltransferase
MPLRAALRTYIITPPLSAFCFTMFWLSGVLVYRFDPRKRAMDAIARFWSWLLLWTAGIRVVTDGLDKLSATEQYVYVSNHLSLADTPLMCAYLPGPFRFLAKESLMRVPIIGGHLRRAGHISVNRADARSAVRSLAEAGQVMESGEASMLIFAEGSRSEDGGTQAFRGGAAHLAIKVHKAVVPLAIRGTNDVMPKGARLLRPGTIRLIAGEPVPTTGMTAQDRDRLTDLLRTSVNGLLARIGA